MKKIVIGVLALGVVATGGLSAAYAHSNNNEIPPEMDMNAMHEMMHDENTPVNYGKMKNVMEQVHPELTKEEIKEMYNLMHGTNGAEPSAHFKGMMGN